MIALVIVFITTTLLVQTLRLLVQMRRYRERGSNGVRAQPAATRAVAPDTPPRDTVFSGPHDAARMLLLDVRGEPIDRVGRGTVESALTALPGVTSVYLSPTTQLLYVLCDGTLALESTVCATLHEHGILAVMLRSRARAA